MQEETVNTPSQKELAVYQEKTISGLQRCIEISRRTEQTLSKLDNPSKGIELRLINIRKDIERWEQKLNETKGEER